MVLGTVMLGCQITSKSVGSPCKRELGCLT